MNDTIKFSKRHLPHWESEEAVYFVTFRTKNVILDVTEQILVKDHIVSCDKTFYVLFAVIVMPDHVHMILKPNLNYSLSRVMKGIKGVSSNKINKVRNTIGKIWMDESFDRIIRDTKEFDEKLTYMFNNPVIRNLTDNTWNYHGWYYGEGT